MYTVKPTRGRHLVEGDMILYMRPAFIAKIVKKSQFLLDIITNDGTVIELYANKLYNVMTVKSKAITLRPPGQRTG